MKKRSLFKPVSICLMMLLSLTIRSQQNMNHLFEMMDDQSINFHVVQQYAEDYFKIKGTEEGSGYEQYKRWEAEMQYNVNDQGDRNDPRSYYEEYKKFQESNGNNQRGAVPLWEEMGPTYWNRTSSWAPGLGRVDCIALDPQNNNNMYIGSPQGGCWKTTDGGTSWMPLTDGLTYMSIGAIAVDPTNSNTLYIGTSGAGMLKSTNGGTTLSQINTGYSSAGNVRKIIIDPSNSQIIIIATSGGIYRSINGGTNWTRTSTIAMNDLEFKPGASATVYASGNRFYRSTDNGVTFTVLTNSITRSDALRITVTAADPNIVYAVQCNGSLFGSFFKSTNSGTSFTETVQGHPYLGTNYFGYQTDGKDSTGQGSYNICIAASPVDPDEVHIGGIITWKTLNGGNSFAATTAWTYPNSVGYTHCDMHELLFVGNILYVGSDGGISMSTDGGDNFINLSDGLGIRMFYRLGCSKTDVEMVAAGAQDNGGSIRKSTGWIDWIGADGMEAAINPTNSNIVYGSSQNGSLYKSTNGGTSYSGITEPETTGAWTTPFLIDQNTPTTLIAGYVQVYKSTNSGGSWTAISNFSGTATCSYLSMAPSNSNYIYAAKGTTIYMTSDGGSTWTDISAGLGGATINRIDVHDSDPKKVAVALSGSLIYTSTDGGTTWTNYTGNFPTLTARCLTYENGTDEGIYVGTTSGVYYRNKTMTGWVLHGMGLPAVPINEIEIQYTAQKVRVATYGRGIWQADQYNAISTFINTSKENNDLMIYPNPANSKITIKINSKMIGSTFIITDLLGKELMNGKLTNELSTINIESLAAGVYFVQTKENRSDAIKLIKQ